MSKLKTTTSWIAAVVVLAIVVAAGVYLVRRAMHPGPVPAQTAVVPGASASTAGAATGEAPRYPVEAAQHGPAYASTAALPALNDSDAEVAAALAALAGNDRLRGLLVSRQIVARIVATVDALPRHAGLGPTVLPAQPPKGSFLTTNTADGTVMAAENPARYAPYMAIVESTEPEALVAWYVHAYPLFQEAYRQLGYPQGYFNDRLIVALDDMLAAPELASPAPLQPSKSYYVFADPALESLSTGQKLMLRLGPDNEAKVKAKLRVIRASLLGKTLPAAAATSTVGGAG